MGNINQSSSSLTERLSIQISNTVLRHNKSHMGTGGHNSSSRAKHSHNLALTSLGGGGHSDDRLSALRARSSVDEIHLSSKAGEDLGTNGVTDNLAGDIDLDGGVDGDHLGHLGNHEGIVGEGNIADENGGVVVHELVARDEIIGVRTAYVFSVPMTKQVEEQPVSRGF